MVAFCTLFASLLMFSTNSYMHSVSLIGGSFIGGNMKSQKFIAIAFVLVGCTGTVAPESFQALSPQMDVSRTTLQNYSIKPDSLQSFQMTIKPVSALCSANTFHVDLQSASRGLIEQAFGPSKQEKFNESNLLLDVELSHLHVACFMASSMTSACKADATVNGRISGLKADGTTVSFNTQSMREVRSTIESGTCPPAAEEAIEKAVQVSLEETLFSLQRYLSSAE